MSTLPPENSPATIHPDGYLKYLPSEEGERRGLSPAPMVFYGHWAYGRAESCARSAMSGLAIAGVETLDSVAARLNVYGVFAQSRITHVGEAATMIARYRALSPRRVMLLYGAWDYNVERAAAHAIACGADGMIMPMSLETEIHAYLFGVMREIAEQHTPPPATVADHVARLQRYFTPGDGFWNMQDAPASLYH